MWLFRLCWASARAGRAERSSQVEEREGNAPPAGSEEVPALLAARSPLAATTKPKHTACWAEGGDPQTQPSNRETGKEMEDGTMLRSSQWTDSNYFQWFLLWYVLLSFLILIWWAILSNMYWFMTQVAWTHSQKQYQLFFFRQLNLYCITLVIYWMRGLLVVTQLML